ncbi:MAG: hypothetical protein WDO16_20710 [Bacteroidota bacterium]
MQKIYCFFLLALIASCSQKSSDAGNKEDLDALAQQYVRLGLTIGQYDTDFVDAYYGPDSLKPTAPPLPAFPKDSLLAAVSNLMTRLKTFDSTTADTLAKRAGWLLQQLIAFEKRIRMFSGENGSFDEESKALYGVSAPVNTEQHFQALVAQLDSLLPGKGTIQARYQQLANHFIIPKTNWIQYLKRPLQNHVSARCTIMNYRLPRTLHWSM